MNFQRSSTSSVCRNLAIATAIVTAFPSYASDIGGLEEIFVTARKRTESIQDVPASVTVISTEEIQSYDVTNLTKLTALSPQFNVGRAPTGSGAQLTLRGIGSSSTSIGIEQSVAVVVDNVYYGQGRTINEAFLDLSHVEMMKGPQALYFGKNATAGVISIVTADPGDELDYMARVGYEFETEQTIGEGMLSLPLTDTLGLRLALRASDMSGGYWKNKAAAVPVGIVDAATGNSYTLTAEPGARDIPGEREYVGRATLKWRPNDVLTGTLKIQAGSNEVNNSTYNYIPYWCPGPTSSVNPNNPCGRNFVHYQNRPPVEMVESGFPLMDGNNGDLYNDYTSSAVTGSLNWDLDNVSINWVSNYNENKNKWLLSQQSSVIDRINRWGTEDSRWDSWSSELRALTTLDGPVNVLGGVYYQETTREVFQWAHTSGLADSSAGKDEYNAFDKVSQTDGKTISVYGQLTWNITPSVEASAGARYTRETKDSYLYQPFVNPALRGVWTMYDPNDPGTVARADQTFNNTSPDVSVTWSATDDINLYVAYKTGYKSGGFSNTGILSALSANPVEDFIFDGEKAEGYEVGVKSELFDRQLRLNASVYDYKYTDLQVDYYNSIIVAYQTYNAGDVKTRGVDAEFEYRPRQLSDLRLRGSVNYNRARYENFVAPCWAGQTPAQGCTLDANGATTQSLSGKPTSVAPEWTASVGISYERPISAGVGFGISADARYSDSYLPSSFANPYSEQPSFTKIDASLRLFSNDNRWEIGLIGRNLTNEFIATGAVDGPGTGSGTGTAAGIPADQVGMINPPRTVQLQLTYRPGH